MFTMEQNVFANKKLLSKSNKNVRNKKHLTLRTYWFYLPNLCNSVIQFFVEQLS